MNKNKILITSVILILICIISGIFYYFFNRENSLETKEQMVNPSEILSEIDNYQNKYFEIIKRHDVLLTLENNDECMQDIADLKNLFTEVKGKIDKNSIYFMEYEKIKNNYKQKQGETTFEMNEFASKNYEAFDKLLNDTYKAVKEKLTEKDFEQLKISEINWLKEVEAYNKVFESKGFGTIGALIKFDYEINMRSFRTLLLMLYLK